MTCIAGKANDGKEISFPVSTTAQELDYIIRKWFPTLGQALYRLLKSRKVEENSSATPLQPLDEALRTPLLIKENGDINKSAIYVQPLMVM